MSTIKQPAGQPLNAKTALTTLEQLFPNDYVTVELSVNSHAGDEGKPRTHRQQCRVYRDGSGHFEAPTWELAIMALQNAASGADMITY